MFNETAYNLALGAGCSPDGARVAAAIAQAESSGIPSKYNPEIKARGGTPIGKGSYGLWQIYLKKHPEFEGWNLYDPVTNARAMYSVSGGCSNWQPWSTYNENLYQRYLQPSAASPGEPQAGDYHPDGATGWLPGLETLTSPIELFSGAPAWLPVAAIVVLAFFMLK